jgi:hypothetical protein
MAGDPGRPAAATGTGFEFQKEEQKHKRTSH